MKNILIFGLCMFLLVVSVSAVNTFPNSAVNLNFTSTSVFSNSAVNLNFSSGAISSYFMNVSTPISYAESSPRKFNSFKYGSDYFFISKISATTWCYQESANVSNQTGIDGNCGLNYSGKYATVGAYVWYDNIVDGDWNSYGYGNPAYNDVTHLYINYTKPLGATSAIWQESSGSGGTQNLTIADSCFNAFADRIYLDSQSQNVYSTNYISWLCYNGTAWINLATIPSYQTWEEAMWWNVYSNASSGGVVGRTFSSNEVGSQSLTTTSSVSRFFKSMEVGSQSLTTASSVSRFFKSVEVGSQSLTTTSSVSRFFKSVEVGSQSLTTTSSVSRFFKSMEVGSQSISVTSSISRFFKSVEVGSQGVTITSSINRFFYSNEVGSQGVTITSSISRFFKSMEVGSQSLTTTSSVGMLRLVPRFSFSNFTITSSISRFFKSNEVGSQGVTVTSSINRFFKSNEVGSQSFTISSSISRFFKSIEVGSQSITTTSSVGRLRGVFKFSSNNVAITSSVSDRFFFVRSSSNIISFVDSVFMRSNGVYIFAPIQSVSISDSISKYFNFTRFYSQSFTISSSISKRFTSIEVGSQGLTISSSISKYFNFTRYTSTGLIISPLPSFRFNYLRSSSQPIIISFSVFRNRIVDVFSNDLFTIISTVFRQRSILRDVSDTLYMVLYNFNYLTCMIGNSNCGIHTVTVGGGGGGSSIFVYNESVTVNKFVNATLSLPVSSFAYGSVFSNDLSIGQGKVLPFGSSYLFYYDFADYPIGDYTVVLDYSGSHKIVLVHVVDVHPVLKWFMNSDGSINWWYIILGIFIFTLIIFAFVMFSRRAFARFELTPLIILLSIIILCIGSILYFKPIGNAWYILGAIFGALIIIFLSVMFFRNSVGTVYNKLVGKKKSKTI